MLRVLFSEIGVAPWVLSEDEFIHKIEQLRKIGFAGTPPGRVSVEAVDELERVKWRAYYPNVAGLAILARQIREGREAVARRTTAGSP
jgi:hypothetical protein